jgi:hypothetical protein
MGSNFTRANGVRGERLTEAARIAHLNVYAHRPGGGSGVREAASALPDTIGFAAHCDRRMIASKNDREQQRGKPGRVEPASLGRVARHGHYAARTPLLDPAISSPTWPSEPLLIRILSVQLPTNMGVPRGLSGQAASPNSCAIQDMGPLERLRAATGGPQWRAHFGRPATCRPRPVVTRCARHATVRPCDCDGTLSFFPLCARVLSPRRRHRRPHRRAPRRRHWRRPSS